MALSTLPPFTVPAMHASYMLPSVMWRVGTLGEELDEGGDGDAAETRAAVPVRLPGTTGLHALREQEWVSEVRE